MHDNYFTSFDDDLSGFQKACKEAYTKYNSTVKSSTIAIELCLDIKFIAILPALNINFHSKEIEFEWLCFGIYLSFKK